MKTATGKLRRNIGKIILLIFSLQLVVIANQACTQGGFASASSESAAASSGSVYYPNGPSMDSADSSEAVAKIASSQEILQSLVSIAGTTTPSAATYTNYSKYRGTFSEDGAADSVSAPMWMSVVNLSGDVCNDLINQERTQALADRRIFKLLDFKTLPESVPDAAVTDLIRHLARSAWGRNERADELALIQNEFKTYSSAKGDTTQDAALMACSAVLASLEHKFGNRSTHDKR